MHYAGRQTWLQHPGLLKVNYNFYCDPHLNSPIAIFFIHCPGTEINSEEALEMESMYWCENKTSLPFPAGSSGLFEPEMLSLSSSAFVFKFEWF